MPLQPRPTTQEEARTRACCGPQYQNVNPLNLKECVASKCMAWRWVAPIEEAPAPKTAKTADVPPPTISPPSVPTHGVCGYIGD